MQQQKDPIAVALGQRRAASQTPKQRKQLAALAAKARDDARAERKQALREQIQSSPVLPTWLKIGLLTGCWTEYGSEQANELYVVLHEAAGRAEGDGLPDRTAPSGPSRDAWFNAGHYIVQRHFADLGSDRKALFAAARAEAERKPSLLLRRSFKPALVDLIPANRRSAFLLGCLAARRKR